MLPLTRDGDVEKSFFELLSAGNTAQYSIKVSE